MANIDSLLEKLVTSGGSDLHVSSGRKPTIRDRGDMVILDSPILDDKTVAQYLNEIMPEANKREYEERNDTDFAYEKPGLCRFRANVFRDRCGMGGVFRAIPAELLTWKQLNLPAEVMALCDLKRGLVIVAGPAGCGKSTTMAAMIDYVNNARTEHIITIEDPIEFVHRERKCLINQREVCNHTYSFAAALDAALREDPDIVMVGELNTPETIELALRIAETGHLVIAAMHTNTAVSTVDRIIDSFPAERQNQIRAMLASSLKGVVAQALCKCLPKGRAAALEVLLVTPGMSALIRDGKTMQIPYAMQAEGATLGMVMMNDSLAKMVHDGVLDLQHAYAATVDKYGLKEQLIRLGYDVDRLTLTQHEKPEAISTDAAGGATPVKTARLMEHQPSSDKLKISSSITICNEIFTCCLMKEVVIPVEPAVYVVLGVDPWGTWTVLDVGQTDRDGDTMQASKKQNCWESQCPTKNFWFGVHAVKKTLSVIRTRLERDICVEYRPACVAVR